MELKTEVVIAGSGITGAGLALLLAHQGIDCLLLARDDGLDEEGARPYDPRALSITPASARILSDINIWQKIPDSSLGRFGRIHVWDQQSAGEINFDCADIGEPALGYIVAQSLLEGALLEAAEYSPHITLLKDTTVSTIDRNDNDVRLTTSQGKAVVARLLVAADGAGSRVRDLAGMDVVRHDYGQQAVACTVRTGIAHDRIARQRFLSTGPLAFLPLADKHSCGIVWSTSPGHAESLLAMSDNEFIPALETAFESRLGRILDCEPRLSFRLGRSLAREYSRGCCVLVGDAAHVIHPMAGLGANMGILDIAVLAEEMIAARNRHRRMNSRRVLRRYERRRRTDMQETMLALELIKFLFEQDVPLMGRLRGAGLGILDGQQPVKNRIMQHAMGLVGDLPQLLRHTMIQGIK